MASTIQTIPPQIPPVVLDFGWYYGSGQRLSEWTYHVGNSNYPPGYTVTAGGGSQAIPNPNFIVASTASLEPSGQVTIYAGTGVNLHTTCYYTVVDATHINITGGTSTLSSVASGIPVYDPRFYVDQFPLRQLITFDAIDSLNLGLPTIQVPTGLSIVYFQWDFGNGQTGFGPYASTTYTYSVPVPSLRTSLTVFDSLGRRFSTSHMLTQQSLAPLFGQAGRIY